MVYMYQSALQNLGAGHKSIALDFITSLSNNDFFFSFTLTHKPWAPSCWSSKWMFHRSSPSVTRPEASVDKSRTMVCGTHREFLCIRTWYDRLVFLIFYLNLSPSEALREKCNASKSLCYLFTGPHLHIHTYSFLFVVNQLLSPLWCWKSHTINLDKQKDHASFRLLLGDLSHHISASKCYWEDQGPN